MSSPAGEGFVRGLSQALVIVVAVGASVLAIVVAAFAVAFGIGAGLASLGGGSMPRDGFVYDSGPRDSKNKLLTLHVEGVILGAPPKDRGAVFFLSGYTFGYEIQDQLEEAAKRSDIKGVLLHLQTPGGTIFGARAIHDGVRSYRQKTNKPVVAYIEGLSASGGVMAMVGATKIYADHGSLVGSIGVLGPQLLFYNKPVATDGGLLESGIVTRDGIEQTIITAGRGKDLGNPFRRPTDEEIALLKQGVEAEYEGFVKHVAENRHIDASTIEDSMGAMVFDNATAQDYGLIDGTASRSEAFARLADLAKIKDYQIVRPGETEQGLWRRLLSAGPAPTSADTTRARIDVVRTEICAAVRTPLVYYGDPSVLCR